MKPKLTAGEWVAKLNADPQYVARRARQDAELQQREVDRRRAEAPLIDELRAAGYDVASAWDLVNTSASYTSALPILLEHLQRPYPDALREGIGRAMAVKQAVQFWDVLTRLYEAETERRAKDGIAVALAAAVNAARLDDLIRLVRDRRHGPNRLLLVYALTRSRAPRASAALLELQHDPDLEKEIRVILRRRKPRKP